MNKVALISTFIVSLIFGYLSEIAPFYVKLFNPKTIYLLKNENIESTTCEKKLDNSICSNRYVLDISQYKNLLNTDEVEVGVGQIIYATQISCAPNGKIIGGYDDISKPGRMFDIFTTYQTVQFRKNDCEKIIVEAWGFLNARRKGQIGGAFVIGDSVTIAQVKRLSEFFIRDFYQTFTFSFILLILVSFRLRRTITGLQKDPFEDTLLLWTVSAFARIGILQMFLPNSNLPNLANKIGSAFILCVFTIIHLVPFIKSNKSNLLLKLATLLICTALMFSDSFAHFFFYGILFSSLLGVGLYFKHKRADLLILAITEFICVFKLNGVSYAPDAMIVFLFYGSITFVKLSMRLRISSNLARYVSRVSQMDQISNPSLAITKAIDEAKRLLEIEHFTLMSQSSNKRIELKQFGIGKAQELSLETIPPVFAHSMSLRKEVWHLKVGSPEFYRIKKTGNANSDKGKYISVLPIYDEERMYGAIAVTGYSDDIVKTSEYDIEMRAILRLTVDTLKTLLKREESNQKSLWQEISVTTSTAITEIQPIRTATKLPLQSVAETISSAIHGSAFIAELDHTTRKFIMKGIHGFNPFVQERFTLGTLYAHVDNEQGPIALAVNKKQPVIVPDVKYLKEVLHENSVQFFEKNNTLSCAGIPIFKTGSDTVWGILWLERPNGEEAFNYLAESPLASLASVVAQYVDRIEKADSLQSTTSALQEFLPPEVYAEVVKNGNYRQDDHGYMMMLDLKGSTKVSLAMGSDYWLERAVKIKEPLKEMGLKYGLKLREYKWDAFIFTRSEKIVSKKAVLEIIQFCREATSLIEGWYNESFTDLSPEVKETQQKGRFCITFGDVSQGMIDGTVKAWGTIGNEIAAVTKMEDYCKKLTGVVFFDESVANVEISKELVDCKTVVSHTSRKIFAAKESWFELIEEIKRAA